MSSTATYHDYHICVYLPAVLHHTGSTFFTHDTPIREEAMRLARSEVTLGGAHYVEVYRRDGNSLRREAIGWHDNYCQFRN